MNDWQNLQAKILQWINRQFQKPNDPTGELEHLKEEVAEVNDNPNDIEEYADVLMLILGAAAKKGFFVDDLYNAIVKKLYINENIREWGTSNKRGISKDTNKNREYDTTVIPEGDYCYHSLDNYCPYWHIIHGLPEQMNGYCEFINKSDVDLNGGMLWDQIKECKINIGNK